MMASLVNVTLFVQIANFIITYLFLHRLFFKPFIKLIDKKEAAKRSLLTKLKEKEVLLLRLQKEKAAHLDTFKATIKKNYTLSPQNQLQKIPQATADYKDDEKFQTLLEKTSIIIEEKVPNVF